MSGQKIIEGLKQAVAGDFASMFVDGARFIVGDRVSHPSGMTGSVSKLSHDGVHVAWDNSRSVGIYDDRWFRSHPGWIKHIDSVVGQLPNGSKE